MLRQKIERALQYGLEFILCIGEQEKDHDQKRRDPLLTDQLKATLSGLPPTAYQKIIVAYEPLWAIGKEEAAPPLTIASAHDAIRQALNSLFAQAGHTIPLLYGGSVNRNNAAAISQITNVDGFLIGRASLNPVTFHAIITAFTQEKQQS